MRLTYHATGFSLSDRPLRDDGTGSSALLVTAHPDDECMFFVPTLEELLHDGVEINVLCLSTGDYEGLGAVRARELRASCALLGLPDERVRCIDDPQLQDGPANAWPPAKVAALVHAHLHALGVSRVVTFDGHGVSGHPNHVAVHAGVRLLASSSSPAWRLEAPLAIYELESTGLLRKHLSVWDVLLSLLITVVRAVWCVRASTLDGPHACCCVTARPWRCHAAMRAHATQYVWYRKLYVLTSRYACVNTLRRWRGACLLE